ncbi:MAG: hypothetical protein M1503_09760 [Thaumarchaeota archaeon]|nr:hypothetical protein [Nitrososphaerota archaeon]MCL5318525.1 hypothetical protein [Nitrososphaerota archaeon]
MSIRSELTQKEANPTQANTQLAKTEADLTHIRNDLAAANSQLSTSAKIVEMVNNMDYKQIELSNHLSNASDELVNENLAAAKATLKRVVT